MLTKTQQIFGVLYNKYTIMGPKVENTHLIVS